jgi:hypothetical protein|tara:strand:+ start:343 stop:510 length:168 start_codon:yes stop_codon:yes gene_type:complete
MKKMKKQNKNLNHHVDVFGTENLPLNEKPKATGCTNPYQLNPITINSKGVNNGIL